MPEEETPHAGFKGTWKFIGWMIGAVIIIFDMLMNWVGTTGPITPVMIQRVLVIAAVTGIGIPAIFYIADIIWTLANKVKETIFK